MSICGPFILPHLPYHIPLPIHNLLQQPNLLHVPLLDLPGLVPHIPLQDIIHIPGPFVKQGVQFKGLFSAGAVVFDKVVVGRGVGAMNDRIPDVPVVADIVETV